MPSYEFKKLFQMVGKRLSSLSMLVVCLSFLMLPVSGQSSTLAGLPDFRELVKVSSPAVVNISTEKMEVPSAQGRRGMPFPPDFFRGLPGDPFEHFFGPFGPFGGDDGSGGGEQNAPRRRSSSLGSGFLISADGYIVTNHHVVKGADVIKVTLGEKTGHKAPKEKTFEAVLVGSDSETDIALIKITAKEELPFLKFGDSDRLEVGEWAFAIGNPFGLDHSVTAGIISAKGRNINAGAFDSFLQTDASINPGNSGGPLLNMSGEVIGINTAIAAQGQGIGFAIPSNMASNIIFELKSNKKVSRGWIGINMQSVDESIAKAMGMKESKGALVGGVMPGEPADKAGLEAGDVIVAIDGQDIKDSDDVLRAIAGKKPGSKVGITAIRSGESKNFTVTLGERNLNRSQREEEKQERDSSASGSLGIKMRTLSKDDARRLKIDSQLKGLLVTGVEQGKAADEAGLKAGDVIISVALKPVSTPEEFAAIVNSIGRERGAVMIQIIRRGNKFFATIELPPANSSKK